MPLITHDSLDVGDVEELVRRVRDIGTSTDCKGPCPDAKAEAHEQAKALGLVLVDTVGEDSMAPRHRLHPMA
jgi:hypothetical protein